MAAGIFSKGNEFAKHQFMMLTSQTKEVSEDESAATEKNNGSDWRRCLILII